MKKVLPPQIKARLKRTPKKPRPAIPEELRKFAAKWGSVGGSNGKKADKQRAGRLGGLALGRNRQERAKKLCREQGINYDKLPDAK